MPAAAIRGIYDDPWLAAQLGVPALRVGADWAPAREAMPKGALFAYAKVPTHEIARCHELEGVGFRLADTQVTLEKQKDSQPDPDARIRKAGAEDEGAVAANAAPSFGWSRFHRDPAIADARANAIKTSWARSYFDGTRGDACLVAESDGVVAGFLLAIVQGDCVTTDLIAVDAAYRRRGIARALMAAMERSHDDARRFRVGTQLVNAPSLHLYQSLGYRIIESTYVFHFHGASVYDAARIRTMDVLHP